MSALPEPIAYSYCRAMSKKDLKAVVTIERRAYRFPWSKNVFADCLRAGYRCQVLQLEPNRGLAGYGVMSVAAGEAHLLNLCIDPDWAGRGLAKQLLNRLLELARLDRAQTLLLEVRPSNRRAVELYRSSGFCELGTRPNYYPAERGREDALLMAKSLC